MPKLRVGIVGGAGFIGGELLRLLLDHPQAEAAAIASASHIGEPVYNAHPNLRGRTDMRFVEDLSLGGLDCVLLASGHGEAMSNVGSLLAQGRESLRLIDMSGDFRLRDAALYPHWYGHTHAAADLLKSFAYGLTELNRDQVRSARRIANPGCIATAAALALGPLAQAGFKGTARVTAVTGSSGSGIKPSAATHHPLREGNMRAYKPLRHQHAPEVEQMLDVLAGGESLRLALVTVSGPFVRGIYCICHLELPEGMKAGAVGEIFRSAYDRCAFIRMLETPPDLNAVCGNNFCDIHVAVEGRQIAVITALDNLVKGAAGQAVQNLNVMMGWEETAGLRFPGIYP